MKNELNMWTLHTWLDENNISHFYSLDDERDVFEGFRLADPRIDPNRFAILTGESQNTMYHAELTFLKNKIYFRDHDIQQTLQILNAFLSDYRSWIQGFYRLNFQHESLQALLDHARRFLSLPVLVLCDSQVIAVSPDGEGFTEQLENVTQEDSIPDMLKSSFRLEAQQTPPFIARSMPEKLGSSQILIDRFQIKEHYIWLLLPDQDNKITPGTLHLTDVLKEAIRNHLTDRSNAALSRYTFLDDYFLSCIHGELPPRDHSRRILNRLHWNPDGSYCVWRVELTDASASFVMNMVCVKLKSMFPDAHIMLYPNGLVLLFSSDDTDVFPADEEITGLLPKEAFVIGKSNTGTGYRLLPDLIRQAFHATQSARKNQYHFVDAKNIVSEFIYQKLHENSEVQSLIHPAIRYLDKIDREQRHPFSCIATLKTLLLCGGNYNETAKRLNIHRNTLVHRIRQICDRCGISEDLQEREALLLSILLLDRT